VFEAHCWTRARLFAEGELDLHTAVDGLQAAAMRDGLVAAVGQDHVQRLMADAFGAVRVKATAWDLGEAFGDHRSVLDGETISDLDYLIRQNDPQQFRKWMARLSVAERQAVRDLLVTA
jgi:uncharacterized protein YfaS (alpha-2-macroglobulin family)